MKGSLALSISMRTKYLIGYLVNSENLRNNNAMMGIKKSCQTSLKSGNYDKYVELGAG
jgi:hypothetical protein